jgi:hypothetical protein
VYEAAEEYQRNNAANDVGVLTNDPSLIWVAATIPILFSGWMIKRNWKND